MGVADNRKERLASKLHRKHLLHRCLQSWQAFVRYYQQERELTTQHQEKTRKMAALLEAAATGKLWSQNENETKEFEHVDEEEFWRQNAAERNERKQINRGGESGRFQNHVNEQGNKRNNKKERNGELLVESVEDEELFSTTRKVVSYLLIIELKGDCRLKNRKTDKMPSLHEHASAVLAVKKRKKRD